MECKLCGQNPVGNNGLVCEFCMSKSQYQAKANLVLEDSERYEWGLVKLTPGTINNIPMDSELVGTWHKYGEGTYWVSLMMPVQALMDRATLLHAEVARRRSLGLPLMGPVGRAPSEKKPHSPSLDKPKKEIQVEPQDQSGMLSSLQALRQRLKR